MNFARHYALGLNLHPPLRKNDAVKPAGDHHSIAFNLPLYLGAFPKHDRLLRNNVSFYVAANPKSSRYGQRALQRDALIDESGPFFAAGILRAATPLPGHVITPTKRLFHFSRARGQVNTAIGSSCRM